MADVEAQVVSEEQVSVNERETVPEVAQKQDGIIPSAIALEDGDEESPDPSSLLHQQEQDSNPKIRLQVSQDSSISPPLQPKQSTRDERGDEPGAATTDSSHPSTPSTAHSRTKSGSTAATVDTQKPTTKSSLSFVVDALRKIKSSADAKKRKDLMDIIDRALGEIQTMGDPQQIDPKVLFQPLKLATESDTEATVITALQALGTLINYSYFSNSTARPYDPNAESLIDQAIDAICDCFEGEATSDKVQLQIIQSLLSAVLNDKVIVHGAGLLKAVRQMYNLFLHSKSTSSQEIAQGTLTQMIAAVFDRARARVSQKEARMNLSKTTLQEGLGLSRDTVGDSMHTMYESRTTLSTDVEPSAVSEIAEEISDIPVEKDGGTKLSLQTFEKRGSFDEERLKEDPTFVTRVDDPQQTHHQSNGVSQQSENSSDDEEDEVYMKDAFLVFRAMCKISIKSLRPDEITDLRSQGVRTKLLSLHIIHTVLFNNISLFVSPMATIKSGSNNEDTPFLQALKQLLCQSLSRNGASSVNRVFEVGCEIFWIMLKYLRVMLKQEVEVFLKEIYLNILDNRNAPPFQKQCFLKVLERLSKDSRALVEVYLNYDCDKTAKDNMFQRIVEHLARMSTTPLAITSVQQHAYEAHHSSEASLSDWQLRGFVPRSLSTLAISTHSEQDTNFPVEYAMKQRALECVVETLRSLSCWAQQGISTNITGDESDTRQSNDEVRDSVETRGLPAPSMYMEGTETPPSTTSLAEDNPSQLEKTRRQKAALLNAVRQFNFKPKRGIKLLVKEGFIESEAPDDIARFLLTTDRLDKAAIGEYLGDGDAENVAIMHAFVDAMDFTKTRFVDALRKFLQAFRLPGEAQKIDRFMLKFAERYITGNPNAFANADTAYVLAYSVIMLNTDQHSIKLKGKKRMTPEDFIKNNRGINDNADLPSEYLHGIYDEIAHNEIVLHTERENAANLGLVTQQTSTGFAAGLGQAFATVGRNIQQEAYVQRSMEIATRTERSFKSLVRAQRKNASTVPLSQFIPATSPKHVGPMLEVTWMPFLTSLSGCVQDTNNLETVKLCLDGLKIAIQIACLFDLESPRSAFVACIARFTNLYNLSEMKAKNVEALRVLLDVAHSEGNSLKGSWRDILTCVSQLDRFQLIAEGVPEKTLPDVLRPHPKPAKVSRSASGRPSLHVADRARTKSTNSYRLEIAEESKSAGIISGVDRIFTSTSRLSGDAIVYFVRALTQVSWQEIQNSGQSQDPRTYSLQKLVEVSGYNMNRVRFEWSNIWQVLGDHFNQVGCHNNTKVVHFALNSLRQLSMRFLDMEELPGFKFQKDFLKPFEHIMNNTGVVQVKEIVLHSLIQLIRARGENIRSGWKTIFGVFTVAGRERYEAIVNLAYENVTENYTNRLGVIISQGAFADLVVCLTEFSKNARFQKKSLQAIEVLKSLVPKMLKTPECPLSSLFITSTQKQPSRQTQEEQYWFPILFAFHDLLMTGEDLELRSRALNYLFDTLIRYGTDFPKDFWDTIWRQLLYPIFMVLKSKSEMSRVVNHEELSVWLSTTMIQALRNMMSLFTHYFDSLEHMLDRFLDLLALCICQENDTLARIGSNCLQTLILQNVNKFTSDHWGKIVSSFVDLFVRTEATALFSAATSSFGSLPLMNGDSAPQTPRVLSQTLGDLQLSEQSPEQRTVQSSESTSVRPRSAHSQLNGTEAVINGDAFPTITSTLNSPRQSHPSTPALEDYRPELQLHQAPVVVTAARRRFFNQIITKCVLQLLMIETVNELFSNDLVYSQIPSMQLLRLMALLKKSYHFAKRFNDDLELRNRLFQEGFMRQPPNLLKQESGSASVYVNILFRMYHDEGEERRNSREQTEAALIPLCVDIIDSYCQLREETQQRNIVTWRPVVTDIIEGYANFPEEGFVKYTGRFSALLTAILNREMGMELQRAVQSVLHRTLALHYDMPDLELPASFTPTSPRANVFGSRRTSRTSMTKG